MMIDPAESFWQDLVVTRIELGGDLSPVMPLLSGLQSRQPKGAGNLKQAVDAGRGSCLILHPRSGAEAVAAMVVEPAESSDFRAITGWSREQLSHCAFRSAVVLSPGGAAAAADLETVIAYLSTREARMQGFRFLVGFRQRQDPLLDSLSWELLENVPAAASSDLRPAVADVGRAAHYAFERLSSACREWVGEALMTAEVEATVRKRCDEFHSGPFVTRIFDGTLTKRQYIDSVANNHQFVRWTTRLLGHAVAMTSDPVLRRSYIDHLSEEIDHDKLLENDLLHLGADVDYVKRLMVPSVEIQEFMCVQESMAGFHRDPLQFLAVPFSIESVTAFMSRDFINALKECIASWGIEDPAKGCTFLASHIHFDGGDDGHWEGSRKMFLRLLRTERQLQQVLNIVHLIMNSVVRAYSAYATTPDLHSLKSKSQTKGASMTAAQS